MDNTGLNITGVWINKKTGAKITARGSVIDGDNMIIMTDKGNITMPEFSENYIQASDDIYDESGNIIGHEEYDTADLKIHEEPILINEQKTTITENKQQTVQQVSNTDNSIIDKLFSKIGSKPKIKICIEWDELPKEQIKMMIDYFDITIEDISNYMLDTYLNKNEINALMAEYIKTII